MNGQWMHRETFTLFLSAALWKHSSNLLMLWVGLIQTCISVVLFIIFFIYLSKSVENCSTVWVVHFWLTLCGFKCMVKTCPRWLLFPADAKPIYGLFWRTYVTEGRLAGIPAQATGQEVRVLSGRMNEARVNEREFSNAGFSPRAETSPKQFQRKEN